MVIVIIFYESIFHMYDDPVRDVIDVQTQTTIRTSVADPGKGPWIGNM